MNSRDILEEWILTVEMILVCVYTYIYIYKLEGGGSGHDINGIEYGVDNVLVLARAELTFATARRGHG